MSRTKTLLDEARTLAQAKDLPRAERLLREVLETEPDSVPALDLLGYVLYFLDRSAEAERVCLRTLELAPEHPYALKGLGLCLAKRGAIDEAVRLLERAIELRATWFDPYWDLSVTLVEAGRYAEACAIITRARDAIPRRAREWDRMERHARAMGARELRPAPRAPR